MATCEAFVHKKRDDGKRDYCECGVVAGVYRITNGLAPVTVRACRVHLAQLLLDRFELVTVEANPNGDSLVLRPRA